MIVGSVLYTIDLKTYKVELYHDYAGAKPGLIVAGVRTNL
jgi:hypothetical protein